MANSEDLSTVLVDSHRVEYKDKAVPEDIENSNWSNHQLVRLVAIGKRFTKVDFSNTTFKSCYLRNCEFDSCNFTGSRISSTNLHGAKFVGCKFDYATFERTFIDDSILTDNCPAFENQKMKFARSLRTNYQEIGDAAAANHAVRVELEATEVHLRKAWSSNDHYYRGKYCGYDRLKQFASWIRFKILDYVWGNGESAYALLWTVIIFICGISVLDIISNPSQVKLDETCATLLRAPQIFFGVNEPAYISSGWLTAITVIRLIFLGFFISILIKRFNRR